MISRWAILMTLCACACAWAQADLPNLAVNPGFEAKAANGQPEGWSGPTAVYSQVTDPIHTGSGALQFVNPDATRYALCTQRLPLEPGKMYEFSVWVKCEDVVGEDSGATICLEWYGADEKYLGGSYPSGIKGTQDWTQVRGLTGRVPENAARCSVACYVRKGMTGKAWWDDVEVRQWLEPPLQTMLLKPNYRGIITPGSGPIELSAQLRLDDYDLKPAQVELVGRVIPRAGGEAVKTARVSPVTDSVKLSIPSTALPPGEYMLNVALNAKNGDRPLGTSDWRLTVLPAGDLQKRAVYIDEHNRCIVNSEPFFPLGMYWSSINEADMKLYADSAFNCLMPYGSPDQEKLDLAHANGMKVIYSIKDIYVGTKWAPKSIQTVADERSFIEKKAEQYRDHPALLAWYLNDELPAHYMPSLEAHQEWMEELDPNHPTWIVLYQVGQLDLYRRTYDVLGTDPYPIPTSPARRAADYTIQCVQSTHGSRPIWQVPQVMNWANYKKTEEERAKLRAPTYEEMRSMTWQCITEGATGLIYYSWFDLKKEPETFDRRWDETKRVAAEVKQWIPMLLSIEPAPQITTADHEWLHWTTRKVGEKVYLFAVNDEDQAHEANFSLQKPPKRVTCGAEAVSLKGSAWTAQFQPFELKVFEITP